MSCDDDRGHERVREQANGRAPAATLPSPPTQTLPGLVHTWPYLTRLELLVTLLTLAVLLCLGVCLDAPLGAPANPRETPALIRAPWYFVGLQELLAHFPPWLAGIVVPSLCIVGLVAIPYLDRNPAGSGLYRLRGRRLAVAVFAFGFVFWLLLTTVGAFLRGPGWALAWPWQTRVGQLVAVAPEGMPPAGEAAARTTSQIAPLRSLLGHVLCGLALLAYYPGLAVLGHLRWRNRPGWRRLGCLRYHLAAFLLLAMASLPLWMTLGWLLDR